MKYIILFFILFNIHLITAEETQLIPRRILFGNPVQALPQLSPDGTKLAYLAPSKDNVLNIWVRDLKVPGSDQLITSEKNHGISWYIWQYDNAHVIYSQDVDGDENDHLLQTNITTLKTIDLTPFHGVKADIVAYDSKFPTDMLIQLNLKNPSLFDVYRLNLKDGNLTLDTENPKGTIGWFADHDLVVRAMQSYDEKGNMLISVRAKAHDPWKTLLTLNADETLSHVVGFTPDNKNLYFVASLEGDTSQLFKIDPSTGERQLILGDSQFDVANVMMHPKTRELIGVGFDKEKFEWQFLDQDLKKDHDFIVNVLNHPIEFISHDFENNQWVIARLSDQKPGNHYLFDRKTKELNFLFNSRPSLVDYPLSPMTPIHFQARDGMKLYGYLTLPTGLEPKNLPTVLFVHGGPWARDSWGFRPVVQWLANRGYAVLQINFRGSTGYGKKYLHAGNKEWGRKMHTDLLDGKQWAIQQGFANPDKFAIYGGSYGGYAALAALAFTPDEFCCAVDIVGPSNLMTLLQTIPPYWAPLMAKMNQQLGDLTKDQEALREQSPLFSAQRIKKPLLIGQGANDPRVKKSESDQIVQAMREKHLPVDYLLFKDEGHGFAKPENRMRFNAAAEAFLGKHMGGRVESPSPEEDWSSLLN